MVLVGFSGLFLILTVGLKVKCDKTDLVDQYCNRKSGYTEGSKGDDMGRMKYKLSIIESWQNIRDREKATDMLNCMKDSGCTFVSRHLQYYQQICTCGGSNSRELCVTVRCGGNFTQNRTIKSDCKYSISKNFDCSQTLQNSNKIPSANIGDENKIDKITTPKEAVIKDCSVCVDVDKKGKDEDDKKDISDRKKSITIVIHRSNIVAANEYATHLFNIIDECSNGKSCPVFVNTEKHSSIFLCVLHSQSICVVLKCKFYSKPNNIVLNKKSTFERTKELKKIWKHWKVEILLFCTGLVLLSGLVGFVIGGHFPCYRKARRTKKHKANPLSRSLNSELYAEICEASNDTVKGPEQSSPDQTQLDGMSTNRHCRHERSESEYGYSHVYNTLQRNYGTKRSSHQDLSSLRTLEMPYSCQQYRSLQTLSDQNPIQGRMSRISV